ncbi:hypothetical protein C84B14_13053 [Salinisphaera sp. C84B14]|uniref:hypothetical protein n=1 Tax=Salinisphaera sp. C84B14 TaxID=1304155 RepID=UPI0032B11133|tara:strand:- start:897 stop:1346 length:450 start_codon:yes stop_codon:yes gene_type:complete
MNTAIAKTTLSAALIAGLVGFSSLGFAQSEAIEDMNARNAQPQETASVETHPMADQLAADLDAFNRQHTQDRVVGQQLPQDYEPAQVSQTAMQLSDAIENYNAQASQGLVPETSMPADATPHSYPQTEALAADLTRYNETGGNLNALSF